MKETRREAMNAELNEYRKRERSEARREEGTEGMKEGIVDWKEGRNAAREGAREERPECFQRTA